MIILLDGINIDKHFDAPKAGLPAWMSFTIDIRLPQSFVDSVAGAITTDLSTALQPGISGTQTVVDLNSLVDNDIEQFQSLLPSGLASSGFTALITTAVKQIFPWLSGDQELTSLYELIYLSALSSQKYSASVAVTTHLAFWGVVPLVEMQPSVAYVAADPAIALYDNIAKDNPGLWAWAVGAGSEVNKLVGEFQESNSPFADTNYIWQRVPPYSIATGIDEDRIDYLILKGLSNRPAPLENPLTDNATASAAGSLGDQLSSALQQQLQDLGQLAQAEWNNVTHEVGQLAMGLKAATSDVGAVAQQVWNYCAGDLGKLAAALWSNVTTDVGQLAAGLKAGSTNVGCRLCRNDYALAA